MDYSITEVTESDHIGHRERLKERFLRSASGSMSEEELLELLLGYAIPRKDTAPLAKDMVGKFGDLKNVLGASVPELEAVTGISRHTAVLIRLVADIVSRLRDRALINKELLGDPKVLEKHLLARFRDVSEERLLLILLNDLGAVLGEEFIGAGTVSRVVAFPREIIKVVLRYDASALILAHNHPGGPPIPSFKDRDDAERLRDALLPFDVKLTDAVVVGVNRCFSIFTNQPL
jgi:DNA repair protein RadC